ncbi:restriction endonuclease subunit S [Clostridium folliculivorans]|uniref:restriction endonuclease subunit S n=1 Tax=Clostridium folliculivorans TaxID=2886038 RepID=UPI0021C3DBFD|nr:restriction endonuclease subunit S [Clostridium folliculivorans]GKU31485.1 hypothetical protein CFB3_35920 [Clostridium folliculivorans]
MPRADEMFEYLERLRGFVVPNDIIAAVTLIEEVNSETNGEAIKFESRELYNLLLHAADKLRVKNPFRNERVFFDAYRSTYGMKIKALDWEKLLAYTLRNSRQPILPEALIKVYQEHFKNNIETVLIAEGEKFVPCLQEIVDNHINSNFTITCENEVGVNVIKKIFKEYDNVEVVMTSIYDYEFISRRYDLILATPAFGGRTLVDDGNFMCREYDMVALENLSFHLNNGGEMVIVLPGRITFASGKIENLRRFVQENYTIKEIAELPEGIFEYTGIKTYLLNIQNVRPGDDDIIIRRYSAGERKTRRAAVEQLIVEDDTFVMLEELENQGDWNTDKIFAQQDEEWMQFQNSNTRKEQIGNVAQLFRGKAVNKKEEIGSVGVVNISNIGEYEVDYDSLSYMEEEERKIANYILQEGDVLLPARGTAIRTSVFHKQNFPCIAHSNVIVIRPNPKMLDSTYLKVFLDSPLGNKQISGAQQGMTVMNISYKDLNVLEIPIPSIEEQRDVAEEYNKELQEYKETISAAEKRWKAVLDKLQTF